MIRAELSKTEVIGLIDDVTLHDSLYIINDGFTLTSVMAQFFNVKVKEEVRLEA